MLRHPPEMRGQIKISLKNLVKQPKPCSVTGPGLQHLFLGLWQDTTAANIFTWLSDQHLWSEKPEVGPRRPPHPLPCPLPRCAVPHRSSEKVTMHQCVVAPAITRWGGRLQVWRPGALIPAGCRGRQRMATPQWHLVRGFVVCAMPRLYREKKGACACICEQGDLTLFCILCILIYLM